MSDQPHATGWLVTWLRANVIATLLLAVSVVGAIWAGGRYVTNYENQIASNQADVARAAHDVGVLQANIVSLDGRVNELRAKVYELHNQSELVEHDLKAQLDTAAALARSNTERSFQPPLPQGPRR
jgi:cell division protein FtsB